MRYWHSVLQAQHQTNTAAEPARGNCKLRALRCLARRGRVRQCPILVTITGPIAAGKNTVATLLADRFIDAGRSVVIDDVAMMVDAPGAGATGTLVRYASGPRCACRAVDA